MQVHASYANPIGGFCIYQWRGVLGRPNVVKALPFLQSHLMAYEIKAFKSPFEGLLKAF